MPEERDEPTSPLEKMRKSLYTPGTSFDIKPSSLSARGSSMPRVWEKEEVKLPGVAKKTGLSVSLLFLIGAGVFFVIAGLIAFLLVVQGGGAVSTNRVHLTIENPPTSIAGGDTVSLFVLIRNENSAMITDAKLSIAFPDGTYSADIPTEELSHHVEKIGNVGPGQSVKKTIRATLFGEANQGLKIPMTLEYGTEGSSATFEKTETFEFTIGTSPVSVNVISLSEVASGQELTFDISVRSNAPTPIEDIALRAEFPFGFSALHASQTSTVGSLFTLGTLAPGEEKKLSITGTLTGQDGDERVFRFAAGTARPDGSPNLAVSFITKEAFVEITRPFIAVSLAINQSENETVVIEPGKTVQSVLTWVNTLQSQIQDAEIIVRLSGDALDRSSVSATGGFYRSSDAAIVFNRDTSAGLRTLQPGDSGNGSFSFATKNSSQLSGLHNPAIDVSVSIAGRRVGESGVAEQVSSTITRNVQVASALSLSAIAGRSIGPFPPVPNSETNYIVKFEVDNGVNGIADAVVKATLPSYVRFLTGGQDGIKYNETTREVSWNIGELAAHAKRSGLFEISFLPSTSQSGSEVDIVLSPTFTGFDRYVQQTVTNTVDSIDSGGRVE